MLLLRRLALRQRVLGPLLSSTALFITAAAADVGDEWPMATGDHANTRYSSLAEIDTSNVQRLVEIARRPTGAERGHEAAPLVIGDRLYLITPWPNDVLAFDLRRSDLPLAWRYAPAPDAAAQGVACCDVVSRGLGYAQGLVIVATLDAQAIALDAATGTERWRTRLGDFRSGETITMAPTIVGDLALIGNSGGEFGVRGWLKALDVASGAVRWEAYSTGPDRDVRLGPAFRPFYASDRGIDLGVRTWPGDAWQHGGGNVWGFLAYDPALDLVFHGTANPGPWNPDQRPGDNKWTSGVFARRPATGEAVWFYQWSPHDLHDYDGVNENVLVDLPIGGALRAVLLHPDRNGYLYVLDRATGQVLSADPFVEINTSRGVDLASGRLLYDDAKTPRSGETTRDICPASPGAKDWQPAAWSPRTRLLYLPHQQLCQDARTYPASHVPGTPFLGATVVMKGSREGRGRFTAWDPVARRIAWQRRERFPVWSGALATAGDLVFYATMDGEFKALDARDGELLWSHRLHAGSVGQPVAYRAPDGHEYIAILAGVGGWAGNVVAGDLDRRDGSGGGGFVAAMRDLPAPSDRQGALYVFGLPR